MTISKVTLLINASTKDAAGNAVRSGGWSESVYKNLAPDDANLQIAALALAQTRARLLPQNTRIVGYRIQQVDPVGPSISFGQVFVGGYGFPNDLPQVALLFKGRSVGGANTRLFTLRGCPDSLVVTGEYSSGSIFNQALTAYFGEITNFWQMKGRVRTNFQHKLIEVTTAGVVTVEDEIEFGAGDEVIFLRTRSIDDVLVEGTFKVASVQTINQFTLANWPHLGFGEIHKGRLRHHQEDYFSLQITAAEIASPKALTREVGRPFGQFSGAHRQAR